MATRTTTSKKVQETDYELRYQQIVNYLEGRHVEFDYDEVDYDEFDIDRSQRNQARFSAINTTVVERYKAAMSGGAKFPPVLAIRDKRGKLIIIDGNHRLAAFAALGKNVPVFIVDRTTEPQTVALMTYECNVQHGLPTSDQERLQQAIWLIDNGATHDTAAKTLNLNRSQVAGAWQRVRGDRRADTLGVARTWDSISIPSRVRLASILTDEAFVQAVDLVASARMSTSDVSAMVTDINRVRSAKEQQEIVNGYTDRMRQEIQAEGSGILLRKPKGERRTPSGMLYSGTGFLLKYPTKDMVRGISPNEVERVLDKCQETREKLDSLIEALEERAAKVRA